MIDLYQRSGDISPDLFLCLAVDEYCFPVSIMGNLTFLRIIFRRNLTHVEI